MTRRAPFHISSPASPASSRRAVGVSPREHRPSMIYSGRVAKRARRRRRGSAINFSSARRPRNEKRNETSVVVSPVRPLSASAARVPYMLNIFNHFMLVELFILLLLLRLFVDEFYSTRDADEIIHL